MLHKNIYLSRSFSKGATQYACDYLRQYPLEKITDIRISPIGHDAIEVSFFFEMSSEHFMQVNIEGDFCVGYRGEGPWGLHDIMIEAGYTESLAQQVFEISRHEVTELIK